MNFLKKLEQNANINSAVSKQYINVNIGDNFINLLEAIQLENIGKHVDRKVVEGGFVWIDKVSNNNIRLFTSDHPLITNGKMSIVEVTGSSYNIDIFTKILNRYMCK